MKKTYFKPQIRFARTAHFCAALPVNSGVTTDDGGWAKEDLAGYDHHIWTY